MTSVKDAAPRQLHVAPAATNNRPEQQQQRTTGNNSTKIAAAFFGRGCRRLNQFVTWSIYIE